MLFGHGLDIEQTEAVALHVVQIAGGNAVELIEYVALLFGSDTCSTVTDGDFNKLSLFGRGGLPATDVYFRCFGRVFYGIVNQVADDVAEVRTVCREGKSGRLDVRRDMHGLLRLQFMLLDKRFENAFHGQRFRMQAEGLAAFHAHGEYLLDKSAEPLQLLLADAQILVALCLFFRLVKVQQGNGLADVLFGKVNPAGRTVQTWVKDITDLPDIMDYDIRNGRTYMYHQGPVLYPFGYGLSYSDFTYEKIESFKQDKKNIRVTVSVKNTSGRDGEEVVQLYASYPESKVERPSKQLRAFRRIPIKAGETRKVTLTVPKEELGYWNEGKQMFVVEPGTVKLLIGASSEDIRLEGKIRL